MYTLIDEDGFIKARISKRTIKNTLKYNPRYVKVYKNMGKEYLQVIEGFYLEYSRAFDGSVRIYCHPNSFLRED
mgnify:CR=1 FL=1